MGRTQGIGLRYDSARLGYDWNLTLGPTRRRLEAPLHAEPQAATGPGEGRTHELCVWACVCTRLRARLPQDTTRTKLKYSCSLTTRNQLGCDSDLIPQAGGNRPRTWDRVPERTPIRPRHDSDATWVRPRDLSAAAAATQLLLRLGGRPSPPPVVKAAFWLQAAEDPEEARIAKVGSLPPVVVAGTG